MNPEQKVRMELMELVIGKIQVVLEDKEQADNIIRLVEDLSKFVMGGNDNG